MPLPSAKNVRFAQLGQAETRSGLVREGLREGELLNDARDELLDALAERDTDTDTDAADDVERDALEVAVRERLADSVRLPVVVVVMLPVRDGMKPAVFDADKDAEREVLTLAEFEAERDTVTLPVLLRDTLAVTARVTVTLFDALAAPVDDLLDDVVELGDTQATQDAAPEVLQKPGAHAVQLVAVVAELLW